MPDQAERRGIKIKELVQRTGVTRATIYHYIREGLLPQPVKTSRNMSLYDPDCVERILLVKGLQKQHRRSLAEVKSLLEGAPGHDGVVRLRRVLEAEATRQNESGLPDPSREALSTKQLIDRTGFKAEEIKRFEAEGVISSRKKGRGRTYDPLDVDVVDALARLARAGFDRDRGFEAEDVSIYVDALRGLLQREVELFFKRVRPEDDPEVLLERAERGIEHVTPLLLALRRKMVRELLDAASLPGQVEGDEDE